jgi:hypothetical protein
VERKGGSVKVNIEIDMDTESHKLDAHLRGPEYKHVLEAIFFEINSLLSQGHPYINADAALVALHDKLKKDAEYFNINL